MTPTPSSRTTFLPSLLVASTALAALIPTKSHAAGSADAISIMEKQIHKMQSQLALMKRQQAAENQRIRAELKRQREMIEADPYTPRAHLLDTSYSPMRRSADGFATDFGTNITNIIAPARTASTPYGELTATPPAHPDLYGPLRRGQFQIGGIRITLGGYLEAATLWRSRNTGSDISTGFNAIPWGNQPAHHMSEFHQTERQSRLAALVEGMLTKKLEADAYIETDFQGSGSSSNSRQSNSYVLRTRVFYGELKDKADGLYFLGGQNWSLITLFNKGMLARDEQTPLVIEAQYVPGFNWTRNTQIRVVKTFGKQERYAVGLSVENPSSVPAGKAYTQPGEVITDRVKGTNINNPDTYYTTDPAPDLIAKIAADPGWGHYELTGVMRFFRDRTSVPGSGNNHTTIAGGGGGGMVLPLINKKLYFQASGLVGTGLGRYGTSNLPDYTYNRNGGTAPLPEANLLLGLYGDPTTNLRLYVYGGAETVMSRRAFDEDGKSYGYGNRDYIMTGCHTELSSACAAAENVRTVAQATTGFWYTAAKGDYGTLRIGGQYAHTYIQAFSGIGGKPHTNADMVFMSLRYMPFN
ncbi:hypothetical protein GS501_09370 [Saccharibacter sp. 17.LH.SD]|uniref:DNA replication initiation control protein YabA n=1 Tax=Saccharibacter sp. 17.LH.SD TaxID=2689393 RepID=UPI00136D229D|nr:DNA replication initiation control protein YabA [Saccharibacter sp. 17.LH.SD]MXV45241.1 hypothetical protein [Saccharibacter sp. 17.LH.SD]